MYIEKKFIIFIIIFLAAPRIKAADQDLVVDVGQPLTMVVPYDAYPRAEAEWYKEDEALPTQTVDTTADSTTFRIYEAKPSHRGSYKIILKNKHGKAEAHINVRVIGKLITFSFFSHFFLTFSFLTEKLPIHQEIWEIVKEKHNVIVR